MTTLIEVLKRSGVRSTKYKRPPFGKDVFALSIRSDHPKGTIVVHEGNAKITAHGSRTHEQVVATVSEGNRDVTRTVTSYLTQREKPSLDSARNRLISKFPVTMPRQTKWEVRNIRIECEEDEHDKSYVPDWKVKGEVTGQVRDETVNHFLMGMDETRNFICALPKKPKSVAHARRMLRPAEASKKKTIRQGEWFFVPIPRAQNITLSRRVRHNHLRVMMRRLGGSTHKALSTVSTRDGMFARGYVVDDRIGHHKSLFLGKWHKVVKNKEATIKVSSAQQEMARQRTRSWD